MSFEPPKQTRKAINDHAVTVQRMQSSRKAAVAARQKNSRMAAQTARRGGGGSMEALRTTADQPHDAFHQLVHAGEMAREQRGSFYEGPLQWTGLGPTPVLANPGSREKGAHTKSFAQETGFRSAQEYQESLGTAMEGVTSEILHGMGSAEGGHQTNQIRNLGAASHGANTEMIPFDKAVNRNPNILVDTQHGLRPGTQRSEVIHQQFFHKDLPGDPLHSRMIEGDRTKVPRAEYRALKQQASRLQHADAAVDLIKFSQQAHLH